LCGLFVVGSTAVLRQLCCCMVAFVCEQCSHVYGSFNKICGHAAGGAAMGAAPDGRGARCSSTLAAAGGHNQ
jgi:hypothetical protein